MLKAAHQSKGSLGVEDKVQNFINKRMKRYSGICFCQMTLIFVSSVHGKLGRIWMACILPANWHKRNRKQLCDTGEKIIFVPQIIFRI